MTEQELLKSFETYVQGIFQTPYGKKFFTQLAIMTDYFSNSLVAMAKLKQVCPEPLVYLEAQRDLARKIFNCLTNQQFSELRGNVINYIFPPKPKKENKE